MVQLSALIAATALAAASAVQATCNGGGNTWSGWPDPWTQQNHAFNACYGYSGNRGAFQDLWFRPYNESPYPATVCVNLGNNRKLVMQVTNLQNNARTLGRDQCDDGLESEIRGCQYGGQSDKSGWRYRSVEEVGNC